MVKISQLPSDSPATGDYVPGLQSVSTSTKRFSFANLIALFFNNVPANSITSAAIEVQQAWQTPAYVNSWVNYDLTYGPAGYYKDTIGIVHLRGLIKNGSLNTTAFTLPAGYRPEIVMLFTGDSSGAECRVDIRTDGTVVPVSGTPSAWISLDGIHFRAFS